MKKFKRAVLAAACLGAGLLSSQAQATNWLMLLGTEPEAQAERAKVFGFLQPTYQRDFSDVGPEPTRIGPNLENQEQFQLLRARIGVRGTGMAIDPKINYFAMFEMGHNGATDGGKFGERTPVRMMDASVTFNHLKGARVRAGLFKTPGPEELLQGIPSFDYINLSWVANQLMLERFSQGYDAAGSTQWDSTFGAGRDTGIQVFDSFNKDGWDHSYALMVGNGYGLEPGRPTLGGDGGAGHDLYAYWSSEKVYGGKGAFQQGWKTFAWYHTGERDFDATNDAVANPVSHDRRRYGIGTRYRKGDWRLGAEYMAGKGMIFQGPEKPCYCIGPNTDLDGKANGYYVDVGYYVPNSKLELDARYDIYNRSTDHARITAEFKTLTLGVQYHLNKKARLTLNYEIRSAETQDAGAPPPMTAGLDGLSNRLGLQATMLF